MVKNLPPNAGGVDSILGLGANSINTFKDGQHQKKNIFLNVDQFLKSSFNLL